MRLLKIAGVATVVLGVAAVVAVLATDVAGQVRGRTPKAHAFEMMIGGGAHIGIAVRDMDDADAKREKATQAGVVIDEVYSESPASRAGLKAGDVVVEFDGERVRSARQFSRLVAETPEGRSVKLGAVRDGQRLTVDITPEAGRGLNSEWKIGEEFARLNDMEVDIPKLLPKIAVPGFDVMTLARTARLGVQIETLTPQLATYFGAKRGALVANVEEGSAAEKAGLRAGDVITAIDGRTIEDTDDIRRALRGTHDGAEVSIEIVRDRKSQTLKAKLESTAGARKTRRRVAKI
ncbi:MAG: PDZ domain-containing protein [Vicinamibacterales bacterium]